MNSRKAILFVLIALLLLAAFWMRRPLLPSSKPPQIAPGKDATSDTIPSKEVSFPWIESAAETRLPEIPKPVSKSTQKTKLAAPEAIPNEHVLRFKNLEDARKFANIAHWRNVEVLGTLDKFNAVRIRTQNSEQLEALLKESPAPIEQSANEWVRIPALSDASPRTPEQAYAPFDGNALSWLGAPKDHDAWGTGVKVAILDTGVQDHPTFTGHSIVRLDFTDVGAGTAAGNYHGHGTAVASLLGGSSIEAPGIAPSAEILSIRVLSDEGVGNSFNVARGIVEAVDRGAQIISLSLGSQGGGFIIREAVTYALQQGVAIVAAVGNESLDQVAYPARYDGVLAVTAIDAREQHLDFANRGKQVAIAAPGFGLNAAWSGNQIVSFSGTSAAVPLVSGALAGILSQKPGLSPQEAIGILLNHADDAGAPGRDPDFGNGILNLQRIHQRDQRDVYDVALSSHYLVPSKTESGPTSLLISAQNRGTEKIPTVELQVTVDGNLQTFYLRDLQVGQTLSQPVLLDFNRLPPSASIRIQSSALIHGVQDANLRNNSRTSVLSRSSERIP